MLLMTEWVTSKKVSLDMDTLSQRCLDFIQFLEQKLKTKVDLSTQLLSQVLVHPSFAHEKSLSSSYERFEFLGDSIVNTIITTALFEKFETESEGTLSRLKAVLISTESLASLAVAIELDRYLYVTGMLVSDSSEKNQKYNKTQGRAFEAMMGAIYLSSGFDKAKHIFDKIVALWQVQHSQNWYDKQRLLSLDVKSILQEKLHAIGLLNPCYVMIEHEKKIPQDEFVMALMIDNKEIARAKSTSKKDAEKIVAKIVLENWAENQNYFKKVE